MKADDAPATAARLSKSKYLAGLQCTRRLWLSWHEPELAESSSEELSARVDDAEEIRRRARALFTRGVLVDETEPDDAVARTRQLLADPHVPAILDAAFEHAGVLVRVDVLERLPGDAWGLRELRTGMRLREAHLQDVAAQRFAVEGSGVRLQSIEMVHVDPDYVRGDADIEWSRFFRRTDVSVETAALLPEIPDRLAALRGEVELPAAPAVEPDSHCFTPYECEFWEYCTAGKPDDWVFRLPWRDEELSNRLRSAGIERISHIPDDFPLGAMQARARTAWRARGLHVEPTLAGALAFTGPPADYLDFETAFPAIPLYAGMRPYQQVPFQWSLHRVDASGRVSHLEFLADARDDPRPAFIESLLGELQQSDAPILVWSGFESSRLAELAIAFPERAAEIERVQARIVDLLPIVREHVYHPEFAGSFSLKRVAPILTPVVRYDDLEDVADGGDAAMALMRLVRGDVESAEEEAKLRRALLEYCRRDTLALMELHRELRRWV